MLIGISSLELEVIYASFAVGCWFSQHLFQFFHEDNIHAIARGTI